MSSASEKIGIWEPRKIIKDVENSIRRALIRLKYSRHSDQGWGSQIERSDVWRTAFAVLFLNSAKKFEEFASEVDESFICGGISWLKTHAQLWSVEDIYRAKSIYEVSIIITCFYQVAQEIVESCLQDISQSKDKIHRFIDIIIQSQNRDGGWDASIWTEHRGNNYSEIGGTSFAIHALAEAKDYDDETRKRSILFGIEWLINHQNSDGSWNDRSCEPNIENLQGSPSVKKTCDALNAILDGADFGFNLNQIQEQLNKAVQWILSQEEFIIKDGETPGWGWSSSPEISSLENTCLTLETLLKLEVLAKKKLVALKIISLPILTNNAYWLIRYQHEDKDTIEDGDWKGEHTSRIALSLLNFYEVIKDEPLFHSSSDRT